MVSLLMKRSSAMRSTTRCAPVRTALQCSGKHWIHPDLATTSRRLPAEPSTFASCSRKGCSADGNAMEGQAEKRREERERESEPVCVRMCGIAAKFHNPVEQGRDSFGWIAR